MTYSLIFLGALKAAHIQSKWEHMKYGQIRDIDLQAHEKYTYKPDPPGLVGDTWISHAADVRAGRHWQGDCDDLASTVLELLADAGTPLSNLYRLEVASEGLLVDHMIACTWDDDGVCWVVGDCNYGEPYPARVCQYRVISYQRMDRALQQPQLGAPWGS